MGKLKILLILYVVLVITSLVNQSTVKQEENKKQLGDKTSEEFSKPTPSPTSSVSPTEIPAEEVGEEEIDNEGSSSIEYVYPGSTIVKTDGSTFFLQSSVDPGAIIDWYRSQIENAGFSAKSTVRTNTNGNVLNKISASGVSQKIEIQ